MSANKAGIGRRVRPRRAADRRLVDVDHLVDVLDAVDPRRARRPTSPRRSGDGERGVQRIDDERALARARHPGHAVMRAERKLDVDVAEIVLPGAAHDQLLAGALRGAAAATRSSRDPRGNGRSATTRLPLHLARVPSATIVAAVASRARPHVDDVVGRTHRVGVVLDDEHAICRGRSSAADSPASERCRAGAGRSTARRARRARRTSPAPICVARRMR